MAKTATKTPQKPLDSVQQQDQNPLFSPGNPDSQEDQHSEENESGEDPKETEPPIKKRGRPPGSGAKEGEPRRLNVIDEINQFDSWDGIQAYIYRHEPISNKPGNHMLKRFSSPFDEDDIMKDRGMGSGVYGIIVNRTDPKTRVRRMITSGDLTIMNMEYPPRMPLAHWVDDPRNEQWQWAKDILEREAKEKAAPVAAAPAAPTIDPLIEFLREDMRAQRAENVELRREIREAQNKKNPEQESFFNKLLDRAMTPPPAPPAPVEHKPSFLETLALDLIKQRLTPAEPAKVETPLDVLDKQIELDKKLRDNYGGGETKGKSKLEGWQEFGIELATAAQPYLAPFANVIARGMEMNMVMQAQQAQQRQQQGQQPQPQQPAANLQEVAPQPQTPPQAGPQLVPTRPTPEQFAVVILDYLKKDFVGNDLGDWYLDNYGEPEFKRARLQGKDRLLMELNSTPIFQHEIAPYAANGTLDAMLNDFIMWEEDDAPDEPEKKEEPDAPPIEWGKGVTTEAVK